jgi:hypothetical protein
LNDYDLDEKNLASSDELWVAPFSVASCLSLPVMPWKNLQNLTHTIIERQTDSLGSLKRTQLHAGKYGVGRNALIISSSQERAAFFLALIFSAA